MFITAKENICFCFSEEMTKFYIEDNGRGVRRAFLSGFPDSFYLISKRTGRVIAEELLYKVV
jgi:hypothetical protein